MNVPQLQGLGGMPPRPCPPKGGCVHLGVHPIPVDRASTRDTLGGHTTATCRCWLNPARRRSHAERHIRCVQGDGVDLVVADSGRMAVKLVYVWLAVWGRVGQTTRGGPVGIRARRAQALAIVTRRDETACGLGRRRR